MKLTENDTMQLAMGAITVSLFSALIGGHLTASYLLYGPDFFIVDIFIKIVIGILVVNIIYFLACISLLLSKIPKKVWVVKATLFMLINIPLTIGYLTVVVLYGI